MNIVGVLLNIIGAIIFLYIFWKKMKEDFLPDTIFTSAFYFLIGILVGLIISLQFAAQWWLWFCFVGLLFGLGLSYYRFKVKIYETVEALIIGLLTWLLIHFSYLSFATRAVPIIVMSIGSILLIIFYILLDKHYKKFTWYKSGRIGFSGLTIGGLFFMLRAVVALITRDMIFFNGTADIIISSVVAFALFVNVFTLAQKTN